MAGAMALKWRWLVVVVMTTMRASTAEPVGVSFGRMSAQKMLPSMVVDMLMANKIQKVKLYSVQPSIIDPFVGTNIELLVAVPNNLLKMYLDYANCTIMTQKDMKTYVDDASIRYLTIGNEPFSPVYPDDSNRNNALPVLENFVKAINESLYADRIRLTIPHFSDVLTTVLKPSEAEFVESSRDLMIRTLEVLDRSNGLFSADINLIYLVHTLGLDVEFAFFDGYKNFTIRDGNITYTNLFDVVYDSFVSALKKAGFGTMEVMVAQVGWPTDGYPHANAKNAERFYNGFIKKIVNDVGTPLRPKQPIKVYLYNLIDENRIDLLRGNFQRHWGIYRYDGKPKFKIDWTGKGKLAWPKQVLDVVSLPERWCIFNGDTSDMAKVTSKYDSACNFSDCSTMAPGGSCSFLNFNDKVSYAFNMYYQMKSQMANDAACEFGGLGQIVTYNISNGTCLFPIQIVTTSDERLKSTNVPPPPPPPTAMPLPSGAARLSSATIALPLIFFSLYRMMMTAML